jgi:hypothetical protein
VRLSIEVEHSRIRTGDGMVGIMQRLISLLMVLVVLLALPVAAGQDDDLGILTSPSGLVAGNILIEVELGASGGAAALFLDGEERCQLTTDEPQCTVDLGSELRVHLLELIRVRADGGPERAARWLNRPGREAEIEVQLAARPIGNMCGGRILSKNLNGLAPAFLEVDVAGEKQTIVEEHRTFGYPCASPGQTRVAVASATYPDGRRAEKVVVTDELGRIAGPPPIAVPLEATSRALDPCGGVEAKLGQRVRRAEREGFEVGFVLDPSADYNALAGLGWRSRETGTGTQKHDSAWEDASEVFVDADLLWFVTTDDDLWRVVGFEEGAANWLGMFFEQGTAAPVTPRRLADAAATAGLTVAASPRRRAVVLVLGPDSTRDGSHFTPTQVRSYLAEIGVPLFVFRNGGPRADGWPDGVQVNTMANLVAAFESVKAQLDEQCVEWFPDFMHPEQIADSLPAGVMVAGQAEAVSGYGEAVWRRASVADDAGGDQPISEEPIARARVEVTAVNVLVRAQDSDGRPVTDLIADEVRVVEDGRDVPVLGIELLPQLQDVPVERPTPDVPGRVESPHMRKIVPVAVYVELQLAGTEDVAPALAELAERAGWLTTLGPVDVVVADRNVETVLKMESDAAAVEATLLELASGASLGHAIERIRTEYVRQARVYPDRGASREVDLEAGSSPDNALRVKTMTAARRSIFEEDAVLRMTMARMNDWALGLPASGPRLLFLVGTGFDEDPIDFYVSFIEAKDPSFSSAARAEFIRYNQATRVESVGTELAAAGWLVVPIATRTIGRQRAGAEYGGGEKFQAFLSAGTEEGGYVRNVDFMLLDPLGSQQHLAEPSGGEVVIGGKGLDKLITESTGWYQLTYQVARAPDGAFHDLEISPTRDDVELQSTGVVVSGTTEGRAAMRLRSLMEDPASAGELSVDLTLAEMRQGEGKRLQADLTTTVDLAPIAPLFVEGKTRVLRFSVAVRTGKGAPFVHHHLASAAGVVGGMHYDVPIEWSKGQATLAVVVEDLSSGAWGGAVSKLEE